MTKEKLKEKYGAFIRFVQRGNRSDIILFENIRFSHLFFFVFLSIPLLLDELPLKLSWKLL